MPDNTALAIIVLAIVIVILGAPFALNEYSKWQEREQIKQIMNRPIIVEKTITHTKTPTTIPTRTPTPLQHKISEGYWCRDDITNFNGVDTNTKLCYQFFEDMTYAYGVYPLFPLRKLQNCSNPTDYENGTCPYWKWSINSKGQYDFHGETFTLTDNSLVMVMKGDYPPVIYTWSSTGIP